MSYGQKIVGSTSGNIAEVDVNKNLNVVNPSTSIKSGFVAGAGEHDAGTLLGTRSTIEADYSRDYRARVSIDNILFNEWFSGTTINTSKWATPSATATVAQASGLLTLNSAASLVSGQGCIVRSWRTFPIFGASGTYFEMRASLYSASTLFNNNTSEWGAAITANTVATAPTDGVYFRYTTAGLYAVVMSNSVEVYASLLSTGLLTTWPTFDITKIHHYTIFMSEDEVEFWIDDKLVYVVDLHNTSVPTPISSMQLCVYGRCYNTSTNTLTAQKLNIASVSVSSADMETAKPWAHKMAGMHESVQCMPTGGTTGKACTAYTQTAMPAAGTTILATALGTNAVAGIGGFQHFAGVTGLSLTADTAYQIFSTLIPAPTIAEAKGLMICGIDMTLISRVAVGVNATVVPFVMELCFGCTNADPATAEAITTNTTPVKGVRKQIIGMGSLSISTAVGTTVSMTWHPQVPVYCEAGTYVTITFRPAITYSTGPTQDYLFACAVDGYWE